MLQVSTKTFTMGKGGIMTEAIAKPALPLYCKLVCYGAGMNDRRAAVISEPDQYGRQKAVYISDYQPGFTHVDEYSRPHSQKFGIGIYYADDLATYDESEVLPYIDAALDHEKVTAERERLQAEHDKRELADLPAMYPHLKPLAGSRYCREAYTIAKGNLVAELKKHFPGVKFSVAKRSSGSDAINVEWTDGPTDKEVEKITGKFTDHETDFTGDYRDPAPTNFNRVFGGFKYIFERRNMSPEVEALKPQALEIFTDDSGYWENKPEQVFYKVWGNTTIPTGATITGIESTGKNSGQWESMYRIGFTIGAPAKAEAPTVAGISYFDYSEKAFAIIGDTKVIKDQLKQLGGSFNPRLSCGPGWIFSKRNEAQIRAALGL